MLNEGTIILLGLERDIWEATPDIEKSRYKRVALCFYTLNVLALVSGGYLMHLMSFGWGLAILLGAVTAFILMSIVRFSLIIYRRSVFDYEKEREKLNAKLAANSSLGGLDEKSNQTLLQAGQKVKETLLTPIRSIKEYTKNGKKIQYRTKSGRENTSSNTLVQNESRIRTLKEKIEGLKLKSENDSKFFTAKITDRYFLVFTITAIQNTPGFYLSLVIVLILIILPHWILQRLKTDPSGYYAEEAVLRYRSIIDKEYQKTEIEGYEYLDKKFGYQPGEYRRNIFWDNPPYCTVPRIHFTKKVRISKSEFLNMEGRQ